MFIIAGGNPQPLALNNSPAHAAVAGNVAGSGPFFDQFVLLYVSQC